MFAQTDIKLVGSLRQQQLWTTERLLAKLAGSTPCISEISRSDLGWLSPEVCQHEMEHHTNNHRLSICMCLSMRPLGIFFFSKRPLFQPADSLYESPTKQREGVKHAARYKLHLRCNPFLGCCD